MLTETETETEIKSIKGGLKMEITRKYLKDHPNSIFVFGDNTVHEGFGGAAKLRNCPNTFGFITKKLPNNDTDSFYKPYEYLVVFEKELNRLIREIRNNPDKKFLISKIGSGLANKFKIWENIIEPRIIELEYFDNVEFLF